MKNFEFWEKEIKEIGSRDSHIALVNEKPVPCNGLRCEKCDWGYEYCVNARVEWFYAEHVEAPKINSRTKKFFEAIQTGWVARDKCGHIYHYHTDKPIKDRSRWSSSNCTGLMRLGFLTLDFIKWED